MGRRSGFIYLLDRGCLTVSCSGSRRMVIHEVVDAWISRWPVLRVFRSRDVNMCAFWCSAIGTVDLHGGEGKLGPLFLLLCYLDLCHVGCARLAGQKIIIKEYFCGVWGIARGAFKPRGPPSVPCRSLLSIIVYQIFWQLNPPRKFTAVFPQIQSNSIYQLTKVYIYLCLSCSKEIASRLSNNSWGIR